MKLSAMKIDLKSPRVRNVLIIVAVSVAGAIGWYQTIYKEKQAQLEQLRAEKVKMQNELNNILAMKPQLNKLGLDIANAQRRLDSLRSIFPDHKEIPRLIQDITQLARSSNISTVRFSPLPDVEKEYYIENRYNVTVAGEYHRVGEFFSRLANLQLLVNLSDMSLTAHPDLAKPEPESDLYESSVYSVLSSFKMTTFSSKQ